MAEIYKWQNHVEENLMFVDEFTIDDDEYVDDSDNPQIRKTDLEWLLINALRDTVGISLKGSRPYNYRQIVELGEELIPSILGLDRNLFNESKENPLYEEYKERAEALSLREQKQVTILQV
jgi:hypothetical protein